MKNVIYTVALSAMIFGCSSGNKEEKVQENSSQEEIQVNNQSANELQQLEENTEELNIKTQKLNQKADSLLESL